MAVSVEHDSYDDSHRDRQAAACLSDGLVDRFLLGVGDLGADHVSNSISDCLRRQVGYGVGSGCRDRGAGTIGAVWVRCVWLGWRLSRLAPVKA